MEEEIRLLSDAIIHVMPTDEAKNRASRVSRTPERNMQGGEETGSVGWCSSERHNVIL